MTSIKGPVDIHLGKLLAWQELNAQWYANLSSPEDELFQPVGIVGFRKNRVKPCPLSRLRLVLSMQNIICTE
jgi:hypothetical protein